MSSTGLPATTSTKTPSLKDEARDTIAKIRGIANATMACYLQLGAHLKLARENRHWDVLSYGSWDEYLEDLGLRPDLAAKAIDVVTYIYSLPFVQETPPDKIKWTTMVRLIPLAREKNLTKEKWDEFLLLSDTDLRRTLGHDVQVPHGTMVLCPQCGNRFNAWDNRERTTVVDGRRTE